MSIVLIFENKDAKPWSKILKTKLPHTPIEIFPKVKNKADVNFVICWRPKKNILQQFPNIKVIQSVGASIDHITNTQILDTHTTISRIVDQKLSNDMWEYLLTVVLSELKNTRTYSRQKTSKNWQPYDYQSIHTTTISILGLGNIGGYVADKFAQLGFTVKGWSHTKKQISNVQSFSGKDGLNTCLKHADFLVNLLPLTDKTKDILNKNTLQKLPKKAFLINVGRGEHLVESDLIELLNASKLSGALLDVFREEPLPRDHPFWEHPKIQITPHVASLTHVESAVDQIVENYQRFLHHKKLLNTVSLKKGY